MAIVELWWWAESPAVYRANGREGREYLITRREHDDLPWIVWTANCHPRTLYTLWQAKRMAQTWEDAVEMADEFLLAGDLEIAERLRGEPDGDD